MYLKTPKYNGRNMKKIKEYERFVLYIDTQTNIRECFQYWDLNHEKKDHVLYEYDDNGNLFKKHVEIHTAKFRTKNDNRLAAILGAIEDYEKTR